MNARWVVSLVACMAVLLGGTMLALAAEPSAGQNQSAAPSPAGIIQDSTLIGTTVLDLKGQNLGRIKDILLDSRTGQASFVLLDVEIPRTGHALLVVPFAALRVSLTPSDHRLSVVLDLRPDQMRTAPQTPSAQSQILQNPQFLEQARNFYQVRTYTAARPIEAASMPCPPPIPDLVLPPLPPCLCGYRDSYGGWPQSLVDFSSE